MPVSAPSFVITPHRSLNDGQQLRVFGSIACVLLTLQLAFLLSGAWPISLFFGADLALLGVGFWSCWRAGGQSEHIRIEAASLHIERHSFSHALHETLASHGAPARLTITHRPPLNPR
jgi:uncharacterized membrane protein